MENKIEQGEGMSRQVGPWLQVAVFCDAVVTDEYGKKSYVGVHDGVITPIGPGNYVSPVLVLAFTGGGPANATLTINATRPGDTKATSTIEPKRMHFDGPRFGRDFGNQIRIDCDREGTWWFDVLLNGILITRMPFRIYAK